MERGDWISLCDSFPPLILSRYDRWGANQSFNDSFTEVLVSIQRNGDDSAESSSRVCPRVHACYCIIFHVVDLYGDVCYLGLRCGLSSSF